MTALLVASFLTLRPDPGPIMIVGGGATTPNMVRKFLNLAGGEGAKILVLPFMREDPEGSGPGSVALLEEHGATRVSLQAVVPKTLSEKRDLARLILESDSIWLPGGDQNLFIERLGLDWCRKVFSAAHSRGIAFFGTSAGAMLMSDAMIAGNAGPGIPVRARGFGLVPFVVDTHFRERNREPRLRYAVSQWGTSLGLGLSEGEWIIWRGEVVEKSGSPVWIVHSLAEDSSSPELSWPRRQASIR